MNNLLAGSEWEIIQDNLSENVAHFETLFTLSNGHFGTRGTLEEGTLNKKEGSYINGFYETNPIIYGETAFGYAKKSQAICQVPDGKGVSFAINGQWFNGENGNITHHKRTFNMQNGTLTRTFEWENDSNEKVRVSIERLVSFEYPVLFATNYVIEPLNFDGKLEFESKLAKPFPNQKENHDDPRISKRLKEEYTISNYSEEEEQFLHCRTFNSKLELLCAQRLVSSGKQVVGHYDEKTESLRSFSSSTVEQNKPLTFTVYNYYSYPFKESLVKEAQVAIHTLKEAIEAGYPSLKEYQIKHFQEFWNKSDIKIEGDDTVQKGLRFNLFHLYQAAGRNGKTNIAAKGLTGDGYEGHYFWDTELYMLPFFIYTEPDIAKQLLLFRHSILEAARKRARELGVEKGALYAWRTINGEECSAYYPAGTAQIHINADIAYAVKTYIEVTNDESFMQNEGLEILIETARFWLEYGVYVPEKGNQFCIHGVTGPDEYTALVDNNYYTNIMAKNNLEYAASVARKALESPMFKKLELSMEEVVKFEKAASAMYLPYDFDKKLTKQDDMFLEKEKWDFEGTPKEKYPLLLHYHPMIIYKYQVNKQADVILAHFLMGDDVSKEQVKRDFTYYESITTHDSSLSRSIFGIVASEIGMGEKAYEYFGDSALMDLVDYQGNTADGIHAANMGGSWMSVVFGFAGMQLHKGKLTFKPALPKEWQALSFKIQFQGSTLQVEISVEETTYTMTEGSRIEFFNHEQKIVFDHINATSTCSV